MKLSASHPRLLLWLPLALVSAAPSAQENPDLQRRRTPVVEVVQLARPGVVSIDCAIGSTWGVFDMPASGTGVVLYQDGIIVTNYHVVTPGGRPAREIRVRFDQSDDQRPYIGRVISSNREEDLALVKIEGDAPFPTIEMSDDEPILGETVIAIGNAVGLSHTVSTGIISGLHRDLSIAARGLHFQSLIQTDAAINSGNSGGPLLDITGKLVGINTAVTKDAENVGYAIPVARVKSVLETHLLNPAQSRSYLGYAIDEASFRVTSVLTGSPADQAGLRVGDRVAAIDGKTFEDAEGYSLQRLSITPGSEVEFTVYRGDERRDLQLLALNVVEGTIHRRLGVRVHPVFVGRWRERYLQIDAVDPNGPAGRIGLQANDVIAAIRPPGSRPARFVRARDLAFLLATLEPNAAIDIEVFRDDDQDGLFERDESSGLSELYQGTLRLR